MQAAHPSIAPQNLGRRRTPQSVHQGKNREYTQAMHSNVGAGPEPGMPPKMLEA